MYKKSLYLIFFLFLIALLLELNSLSNIDYYIDDKNYIGITNSLDNKITQFKEKYNINIVTSIPNTSNYEVIMDNNGTNIIDALNELENFLIHFDKTFFDKLYLYGMNGLNIYFADFIYGINYGFENTTVNGFYFKNDSYNIVVKTSGNLKKQIAHEFMHMIDDYLTIYDYTIDFNNLNPPSFTYSHTYYIHGDFKDTISSDNFAGDIYFVDNYSRSSLSEDKARIFELICTNTPLYKYPNLQKKANYLINQIEKNIPDIHITY